MVQDQDQLLNQPNVSSKNIFFFFFQNSFNFIITLIIFNFILEKVTKVTKKITKKAGTTKPKITKAVV